MTEPVRLVVVSQYWAPAQLAGGARSTQRVVAGLGESVRTWVVTGDRDVGDREPWPDLPTDWTDVEGVQVSYRRWDRGAGRHLAAVLRDVDPDLVYLPSLFAPGSLAVLWRRALGVIRVPVVIAPEGELHPGALAHHRTRKKLVVLLARATGLGSRLRWRAADETERSQLRSELGGRTRVTIAPDVWGSTDLAAPSPNPAGVKIPGRARIVFVSSIAVKKGLLRALELLWPLRHQVQLDIYGPVVDADERDRCSAVLAQCEPGVAWQMHAPIPHDEVARVFADADLSILPTRGENHGYAIAEALTAGCPVLVSDQTPWRALADEGCGWDLPLDPVEPWLAAVSTVIGWDATARAAAAAACRRRAAAERDAAADAISSWRHLIVGAAQRTST